MRLSRWLSSLPLRMRMLLQRGRVERELHEEMEFHLAARTEEFVASGTEPNEARIMAQREMRLERQMERCREERAWQGWERLRADLRFGWRQLKKRKVTTTAAVLSLGLAIGSCMAAFQLVDALFLRPLPVAHPERLYLATYGVTTPEGREADEATAYPMYAAMRDAAKRQAGVLATSYESRTDVTFGSDAEMERAGRQYVSASMFAVFGLRPAAGRLLNDADDQIGKAKPVAVISYDYWTRRFGRDPKVVGRTFHLAETTTYAKQDGLYEIVGVAPKGFNGDEPGEMTDIFLPLTLNPQVTNPDSTFVRVFVSPDAGVTLEPLRLRMQAANQHERQKFLASIANLLGKVPKKFIDLYLGSSLVLVHAGTGISYMQQDFGTALTVLSVLVGMVLLIACVNVANLMAGQAAARAREMAVRVSLGAGRRRLLRLVMVESAMVGGAAAALGALFALWAAPFIGDQSALQMEPLRLAFGMDWRMVAFAATLTVGVTTLFGLIPALRASRVQPVSALKGGADQPSRLLWMHSMVAAQVAFCFVVLFSAGLFVTTFERLAHKPLGFEAEHLLLVDATAQQAQPVVTWEQTAEKLGALPGVERVSLESWPLLEGNSTGTFISIDGKPPAMERARFFRVSPGWLETMRMPLLAGRDLRPEDTVPGAVLVNEQLVKDFFGGSNPIGRSFDIPEDEKPGIPVRFEVVGIVPDAVYDRLHSPQEPIAYMPIQMRRKDGLRPLTAATFVIRTNDKPMSLAKAVRKDLPQIGIANVRFVETLLYGVRGTDMSMMVLPGLLLLLAAIGAAAPGALRAARIDPAQMLRVE